jgi:hypothetical protein
MKLPNVQSATMPERKMTHYLLNPAHPAGGSKAWFIDPDRDAPRFVTAHPLPK